MGKLALEQLLSQYFYVPRLTSLVSNICKQCEICAKNSPKQGPLPKSGIQHVSSSPFEDLEVDFTELPRTGGYKYLLVIVWTFSEWVETFPIQTEKAQEVVHALLKEIIPRYGIPIFIVSDNGPALVAEVLKQLAKGLKITLNLHTEYRPQSSGRVERINQTLKTQMNKLCQETHLTWEQVLPLVLLRVRCPTKQTGILPYEIFYGRPPPE
jgi:transposase InsO family protein